MASRQFVRRNCHKPLSLDFGIGDRGSHFEDRFAHWLGRAFKADGQSGTRKILKPAISGNPSAASADTRASTAAVTSPLLSRSIAAVCPALTSTETPDTTNPTQTSSLDAEYLSSIATVLPARSVTDLTSGRAMTTATRRSVLSGASPLMG